LDRPVRLHAFVVPTTSMSAQSGRFRPPNPADSGHLIRIIPAA
jgi:hypothetical protein